MNDQSVKNETIENQKQGSFQKFFDEMSMISENPILNEYFLVMRIPCGNLKRRKYTHESKMFLELVPFDVFLVVFHDFAKRFIALAAVGKRSFEMRLFALHLQIVFVRVLIDFAIFNSL